MQVADLWVLVASALVFFMQAGFLCFEVGLARESHRAAVAMKNLFDWAIVTIVFALFGSAVMFGGSFAGLFGTSGFGDFSSLESTLGISPYTFLLFQTAFAGTAVTLVSGALVERVSFGVYVSLSILVAVIIYPVVGHWVWGGTLTGTTTGWLGNLGFYDFAGAGVVHLTGGSVALIGVIIVGPRLGRFKSDGSVNHFESSDIPFTAFGTLLLWLGWWGFNGGSVLDGTADIGKVIFSTNIAGAGGLISGFFWAWKFGHRTELASSMIGGALGGLVAVTSIADAATPLGALSLGLAAGPVYVTTSQALLRARIDDALNVVPVHAVCGMLGLLLAPFVAEQGTFNRSVLSQFGVQLIGATAIVLWAMTVAGSFLLAIKKTVGIRVSPSEERDGEAIGNPAEREQLAESLTSSELADLL